MVGTELASMLGRMADSALQGSSFYDQVEFLIPVPLHWTEGCHAVTIRLRY